MVGDEIESAYADLESIGTLMTERGRLRVYQPVAGVSVVVMQGHMELDHAEMIIEIGEQILARETGTHAAFHDYLHMTGYDSAARVKLTRWGQAQRSRVTQVHVLQSSRLVAMGVAAAGLALSLVGTSLDSYVDPRTIRGSAEASSFETPVRIRPNSLRRLLRPSLAAAWTRGPPADARTPSSERSSKHPRAGPAPASSTAARRR